VLPLVRKLPLAGLLAVAVAVGTGPARADTPAAMPGVAAAGAAKPAADTLAAQVRATEIAFAKTMADRDHEAFTRFLADEAVFVMSKTTLRGKDEVAEAWKGFYEGSDAPFSWVPERVEVLESGTLGLSVGPVYDPAGKRIGTYVSTWRLRPDGRWEIVFDGGCPPCPSQP
jgi:ketosteroid isomerase-like protein